MIYNYKVIRKSDSRLMRIFASFLGKAFLDNSWTTYRMPFCNAVIACPDSEMFPALQLSILAHERIHVAQFAPWYGPLKMAIFATIFPLPTLFSGRWFIERAAYLHDIKTGRLTLDAAVTILWRGYGYPWPRRWMRRWFERKLMEDANG